MNWLFFVVTGWLPILFGVYLTYKGEYHVIASGCFLIAFCGFRQVYYTLKVMEMKPEPIDRPDPTPEPNTDILAMYKKLEAELQKQKAEIRRNHSINSIAIRDLYKTVGKKSDLEGKVRQQQIELNKVNKSIEQRDKELLRLRRYDD